MLLINIEDIKGIVNKLLTAPIFDSMYLYEAEIKNASFIQINGRINKEFFDTDDEIGDRSFLYWSEIKAIFFQAIRGKRLPLSFKIVLMPNEDTIKNVLLESGMGINESDISSLNMNIYYDREEMTITSGTSLKIFTMDRSLDYAWEAKIKEILNNLEIS